MCKFNTRLFSIFLFLIAALHVSLTLPVSRTLNTRRNLFLDDYDYDQNFDLHYDQRQNGTENYRVNFNGFLIALPEEVSNNSNILSAFGIYESDFPSFVDKYENEGVDNFSAAHNDGLTTSNEDLSNSKLRQQSQSTDSSGKSINGRDSIENVEKANQHLKSKFPFVSFLKYFRRNKN